MLPSRSMVTMDEACVATASIASPLLEDETDASTGPGQAVLPGYVRSE
jgi:hypothetical protein